MRSESPCSIDEVSVGIDWLDRNRTVAKSLAYIVHQLSKNVSDHVDSAYVVSVGSCNFSYQATAFQSLQGERKILFVKTRLGGEILQLFQQRFNPFLDDFTALGGHEHVQGPSDIGNRIYDRSENRVIGVNLYGFLKSFGDFFLHGLSLASTLGGPQKLALRTKQLLPSSLLSSGSTSYLILALRLVRPEVPSFTAKTGVNFRMRLSQGHR